MCQLPNVFLFHCCRTNLLVNIHHLQTLLASCSCFRQAPASACQQECQAPVMLSDAQGLQMRMWLVDAMLEHFGEQ